MNVFKGIAEKTDSGWFVTCDIFDPYGQVPRILPIIKMDIFDFEMKDGSEYKYEIHLFERKKYIALLIPD